MADDREIKIKIIAAVIYIVIWTLNNISVTTHGSLTYRYTYRNLIIRLSIRQAHDNF